MKNKTLFSIVKDNKFYIILFFFVLILARFFSMSPADDYMWSTSDGWEIFYSGFENYNGRYLGNLSVLFFIRNKWLNATVKAFTMTFLVYITTKLANGNNTIKYLFAVLLLIPLPNFVKTFVWSAGFYNYMFPLMIYFSCAYILLKDNENKNIGVKILLFVFGVAGQLFMETYTIAVTGTLFCFIVQKIRQHEKFSDALVYFIGSVVGAVIMFSNGAYMSIVRGETDYQKIESSASTGSTLLNALSKLFNEVSCYVLYGCIPAFVLLTVMFVCLARKNNDVKGKKAVFSLLALQGISIVMIILTAVRKKAIDDNFFMGVYISLFTVSLLYATKRYIPKKKRRIIYNLLIICAALTLPFSVLHPVGSRCFQLVVVLFMFIVKIYAEQFDIGSTVFRKAALTALLLVCTVNIIVYPTIYFANENKIETIRTSVANGDYQVEVKHTPLRRMVYAIDSENKSANYRRRFCEYYGFPQNTVIVYEGESEDKAVDNADKK